MKHLYSAAAAAVLVTGCLFSGHAGLGSGGGSAGTGVGGGGGGGLDIPGEWSLQERQYWQKLIEEQNSYLKILNDDCGTQVTASFVWESFRPHWKPDQGDWGLDAYDRAHAVTPLTAVRDVCVKGAMEKSAVQAGIGEIVIEYGGGTDTDQPRMGLQGGVFHIVIEPQHDAAGSWEYKVVDFVEKHI